MTTRRSGFTTCSRKVVNDSRTAAARETTTGSARRLSARERVCWNESCNSKVRIVYVLHNFHEPTATGGSGVSKNRLQTFSSPMDIKEKLDVKV